MHVVMGRAKSFLKNLFILSFGTILPKLSSLITLPIITGGLLQDEYGSYDLITTLVSLLLPVVTLQIQVAAFRFLIDCRDNEEESKTVISTIMAFCSITSIIALFVLYFFLNTMEPVTRIVVCSYFFVDIIFRVLQQVARGYSMNKVYSVSSIIESLLNLLLVILFVSIKGDGLIGVLLAVTVADIVAGLFTLVKGKLVSSFSINSISFKKLKEMLKYSGPMVPNNISIWVLKFSDRMVLTSFIGLGATAIYGVANKFPNILGMIMQSFTMAWQENASISVNDEDVGKYYSKMFDIIVCFMAGTLGLLIASTPVFFKILIHGDYDSAYVHIPILYIAAFFDCIKTYIGGIYVAKMKTKSVATTTIIAAVINLAIDLLLILKIGIFAASISTLISCAFLAFYRMYDVQKIQRIDFNVAKVLILVAVLATMSFLCSVRDKYTDFFNIIVSVVFAIVINRELIKMCLSKFDALKNKLMH